MYDFIGGKISNKATWSQAVRVEDESGNAADISSATITVKVRHRSKGDDEPADLTATVGDGITVASPIFTFQFTDTQMDTLCPGFYRVAARVEISDFVSQIFLGDVNIVDGV